MSKKTETAAVAVETKPVEILPADAIAKEVKPLSKNVFLAFWQGLWFKWLGFWYGLRDKYPRFTKWFYLIVFFVLFSQGVTIFQYLIFLFLPQAFGQGLAEVEWLFPGTVFNVVLWNSPDHGIFYLYFLGKPIARNTAGEIIIGGGLGYFAAFLIATFLAQCINFPLQRNITFKSKGSPAYQAMWYFIGWIFIQPFCDLLGSLYAPLVYITGLNNIPALRTLVDTIVMGGVSMLIFFFVFMIIFPNVNTAVTRAQKNLDGLKAKSAPAEKIAAAELKLTKAVETARLYNTRVGESKAVSQASSRAVSYKAVVKNAEKANAKAAELEGSGADETKIAAAKERAGKIEARIPDYQAKASEAIAIKYQAMKDKNIAYEEISAIRTARGEDINGKVIKKTAA